MAAGSINLSRGTNAREGVGIIGVLAGRKSIGGPSVETAWLQRINPASRLVVSQIPFTFRFLPCWVEKKALRPKGALAACRIVDAGGWNQHPSPPILLTPQCFNGCDAPTIYLWMSGSELIIDLVPRGQRAQALELASCSVYCSGTMQADLRLSVTGVGQDGSE